MPRGAFLLVLAGKLRVPGVRGLAYCELEKRSLWQCNACRTQTSLTAGTIFAATKLDLMVWFRALFHMTQTKQGISALELSRRLDSATRPPGRCTTSSGR